MSAEKARQIALFQFPTGSVLSADVAGSTPRRAAIPAVSIPHGKCPVCRPALSRGRGPSRNRFNSPREVSCLPTNGDAYAADCVPSPFQFPTGSVLSADLLYRPLVFGLSAAFQFPTGSVLSADVLDSSILARETALVSIPHGKCPVCRPAKPALRLAALLQFQFPTGSVLSADSRYDHSHDRCKTCFNSPREVSCLPTPSGSPWAAGLWPVSIPHGKCPVCRQGLLDVEQEGYLCVSIPHGKCPVCRLSDCST